MSEFILASDIAGYVLQCGFQKEQLILLTKLVQHLSFWLFLGPWLSQANQAIPHCASLFKPISLYGSMDGLPCPKPPPITLYSTSHTLYLGGHCWILMEPLHPPPSLSHTVPKELLMKCVSAYKHRSIPITILFSFQTHIQRMHGHYSQIWTCRYAILYAVHYMHTQHSEYKTFWQILTKPNKNLSDNTPPPEVLWIVLPGLSCHLHKTVDIVWIYYTFFNVNFL